jgi:hypothetical protein
MGAESEPHISKNTPFEQRQAQRADLDSGKRFHPSTGVAASLVPPSEDDHHRLSADLDTRLMVEQAALDEGISLAAVRTVMDANPQALHLLKAFRRAYIELSTVPTASILKMARGIEDEGKSSSD